MPRRPVARFEVDPLPCGARPARAALAGHGARLVPLDPATHPQALYAAVAGHDAVWDYMPYGPFANEAAFTDWFADQSTSTDPLFFAICDRRGNKPAGMASFLNSVPCNGRIEIGHIWLAPQLQNTRQATAALFLMMRYAMDDLACRRLEWKCDAMNAGSRRAAARLGFTFEGEFYNHIVVKGYNRDTAWFSILDSEWPVVRTGIEAWLADANFDSSGRQRQSLRAMTAKRA